MTVTTDSTVADANTSDVSNTKSSMGDGVSHMGDMSDLGVVSLAGVSDLHHGAAVAAVGVVSHVLDPAVRERHAVLALDVPLGVPGPALAEVGVVVIVVHAVGEVEGVGLVVFLMVTSVRHFMDHGDRHHVATVTSVTNEANSSDTIRERDTGDQAREDGESGD